MTGSRIAAAFGIAVMFAAAACGGADEHPLGGPFGDGTSASVGPTGGNSGDGGSGSSGGGTSGDAGSGGGGVDAGGGGGGSADSGAAKDSGGGGSSAPTWSSLYSKYLGSGTEGRCTQCHSQTSSASSTYSWLSSKGQMSGSPIGLVNTNSSYLSWFQGSMPPNGPSDATAVKDFEAWANAGAKNN